MKRRRTVATAVVIVAIALAGCIGPFADSSPSDEVLDADGEYTWDADTDVHVTVDVGSYAAVYDLDGETTFELSQRSYYRDRAVDIEAVRFQYPNGTELTGSDLEISQSRSTTTVEVPDGNGTLAFTAPAGSKEAIIPGLVEGSYTIELPENHRVGNFFLSNVRPSNDDSDRTDGRQVLTWEATSSDIYIQFYLSRDHYLFYGMIIGGIGIGIGGTLYYRRQIRQLAERRRRLAGELLDD